MFKKLFLSFFVLNGHFLFAKDFNDIVKEADSGDAEAQYQLAEIYRFKDNDYHIPMDRKKAFEYYKKSAEQGHDKAQFRLADLYEFSKGDLLNAFYWYWKSAEQNNPEAQSTLGKLIIVEIENEKEGLMWIEKASNQNDSSSTYYLIDFYKRKNDLENVKKWYNIACKQYQEKETCQEAEKLK